MNVDALIRVTLDNLGALLFWLILSCVILYLCKVQRLNKDMIKNAYQDTEKIKKLNKALSVAIEKPLTRKEAKKRLSKIKYLAKNTKSILQLYIYENGDDPNINAAIKLLVSVQKDCNNFAKAFNLNSPEDLKLALENTYKDLDRTSIILNAVLKSKEEEALLKL